MKQSRNSGFTLIEIMVVLALVAIITSITFGAFRSVSDGNKRTSCQSNLSQIYQSCRLYAQDYEGRFPYLNTGGAPDQSATPFGGNGLWSLYTFPKPGAVNCSATVTDYSTALDLPLASDDGTQLAGYVKSAKIFHCPADRFDKSVQVRTSSTACATFTAPTASLVLNQSGADHLNPAFLSYQTVDDTGIVPKDTYSSFRDTGGKRQLSYYTTTSGVTSTPERPTDDKTVVTWCRFHRSLDKDGLTLTTSRNYDNVLFSDGTVQNIPASQPVQNAAATQTGTCTGWKRVPREKADSMNTVATCLPSP